MQVGKRGLLVLFQNLPAGSGAENGVISLEQFPGLRDGFVKDMIVSRDAKTPENTGADRALLKVTL
jgi:hypothetical protein